MHLDVVNKLTVYIPLSSQNSLNLLNWNKSGCLLTLSNKHLKYNFYFILFAIEVTCKSLVCQFEIFKREGEKEGERLGLGETLTDPILCIHEQRLTNPKLFNLHCRLWPCSTRCLSPLRVWSPASSAFWTLLDTKVVTRGYLNFLK